MKRDQACGRQKAGHPGCGTRAQRLAGQVHVEGSVWWLLSVGKGDLGCVQPQTALLTGQRQQGRARLSRVREGSSFCPGDSHASASFVESWALRAQGVAELSPPSWHTPAWGTALRTSRLSSGVCLSQRCPVLR